MIISIHFWLLCFCPLTLLLALVNSGISDYFVFSVPLSMWQTWLWPFHLVQEEGCVAGLALVECSGSVANVWDGMCLQGGRRGGMWDLNSEDLPPAFCEDNLCALKGSTVVCFLLRFGREGLVWGFLNLASSFGHLWFKFPPDLVTHSPAVGPSSCTGFKMAFGGQPGVGATGMPFVPVSLQSQPQPAMTRSVCLWLWRFLGKGVASLSSKLGPGSPIKMNLKYRCTNRWVKAFHYRNNKGWDLIKVICQYGPCVYASCSSTLAYSYLQVRYTKLNSIEYNLMLNYF